MNKKLVTIGASLLLTLSANAALILNDSFSYPDGSITANSGGVWTNHSGTTLQVDVTSGVVNLTQSESEDVSAGLAGGPITTGNIYASFKINLSALPAGSGGYFFHYRDTGTSNFRARTFVTTTGAAVGMYRIGITSGGNTPAVVPVDLNPLTEYKVVVRYNTETAAATVWINPTSEDTITSRADATDTGSVIPVYSVCLRQSLSSGNGMGTLTLDDLLVGTEFSDVQTIGGPPSISGLVDVSIPANGNTGPLPFLISDVETPATGLTVAATSANPTLVPNNPANLTFGGSDENRTLTVTPAPGEQGTALIEVVVTDGNNETATNTFTLTVGIPTISSVGNVIAAATSVSAPIVVTVGDNETAPASLTVTATSSNPSVLPDDHIAIQVSGATRTLYLTNIAAGVATVTVTVSDGVFNVPTSFTLTAYPDNGILLTDDFSYADGSIISNSFVWTQHSGTSTGETQVVNGKLLLVNAANEDVNGWFTIAPISDSGGQLIYTRFILNLSALPTASGVGEYFTHVYAFSGAYRARVFANTNGAAAGSFRLGISSSSFTPTVFPQNLSLNQDYVVITRYNTATAEAALWVNPVSEASPNAASTDTSPTITAYGIAFRQQTGIGSMSIDDLVVGSTFSQVITNLAPVPGTLNISLDGPDVVLTWADPQFQLQAAPEVTGTYTNIPGATSPYTTSASGDQRYFRLVYP